MPILNQWLFSQSLGTPPYPPWVSSHWEGTRQADQQYLPAAVPSSLTHPGERKKMEGLKINQFLKHNVTLARRPGSIASPSSPHQCPPTPSCSQSPAVPQSFFFRSLLLQAFSQPSVRILTAWWDYIELTRKGKHLSPLKVVADA